MDGGTRETGYQAPTAVSGEPYAASDSAILDDSFSSFTNTAPLLLTATTGRGAVAAARGQPLSPSLSTARHTDWTVRYSQTQTCTSHHPYIEADARNKGDTNYRGERGHIKYSTENWNGDQQPAATNQRMRSPPPVPQPATRSLEIHPQSALAPTSRLLKPAQPAQLVDPSQFHPPSSSSRGRPRDSTTSASSGSAASVGGVLTIHPHPQGERQQLYRQSLESPNQKQNLKHQPTVTTTPSTVLPSLRKAVKLISTTSSANQPPPSPPYTSTPGTPPHRRQAEVHTHQPQAHSRRPHHKHSHSHPTPELHLPLHQHQPYSSNWVSSSSQPPQLPPLSASLSPISPFDPFNLRDTASNYFLAPARESVLPSQAPAHDHRAIPRFAVAHQLVDDCVVSPISDTDYPSAASVIRSPLHTQDPTTASHASSSAFARLTPATSSVSRRRTWDSLIGSSLLDDREFELSLGVAAADRSDRAPARLAPRLLAASTAVTNAVAHDAANLITDDGSDDWFEFTARESTASKHTRNSFNGTHRDMSVAMASDWANAPTQQQQPAGPSSSFIPLPPIRRTSTFDLLRAKGYVNDDGSDTAPSPIEKDIPHMPPLAQATINGQLSTSHASPHNAISQLPSQQSLSLTRQSPPPTQQHNQSNGFVPAGPTRQSQSPPQASTQMQGQNPQQPFMGRVSPAGQHPPGQISVNGQGQTIISLPGGRQWTVQESRLAEPLNPSNRNRAASPQLQQSAYTAYDKETEDEPAPAAQVGAPSQPFPIQTRPRNASNSVPPSAASKYPALFSGPNGQFQSQQQGQIPTGQQHPLTRQNNPGAGPRPSMDAKDAGVRFDQMSVSSEEVSDKPPRRGSASLFGLGHRRNSSDIKSPPQASPEKKKHFFGSVPGITSLQAKAKSNLGFAQNTPPEESDQASTHTTEHPMPGGRKRLSELKGMIKGVGNAKEGARDEQPARPENSYPSIPPIQNPPRNFSGQFRPPNAQKPQGVPMPQGQINPFTRTQIGPQGQLPPPESQAQAQAQAQPQGQSQQPAVQGQMQMGRPMMAGQPPVGTGRGNPVAMGRGNLTGPPSVQMPQYQPASMGQQVKSEENGNKTTVGGFLGGLFNKQANKGKETKMPTTQQTSAPGPWPPSSHSMHPGQQFRPGQMQIPGQPLGPHPMLAGQPPIQPPPPGQSPSPGAMQDSTQPPPSLETAQAVMIRRPSEITVSSQPGIIQPQSASQQGSPNAIRQRVGSPLGQPSIQRGSLDDVSGGQSEASPQLSQTTSNEQPLSAPAPVVARISPNRKPVGSGTSKPITSQRDSGVSPSMGMPDRSTASPSPTPNQRSISSRPGPAQSPPSASSAFINAHQQPFPSPSPSPAPSQSNQSSASTQMPSEQASRVSPDPRETGQGLGVFQNGVPPSAGPSNAAGTLQWGPNGFRPTGPPISQQQAPKPPSSPVPSMDQSKLSKFFGAYDGGKPSGQSQASKDKSAASKFLGAFKKSKQSGAPQPQTGPQPVQVSQQAARPGMAGPPNPAMSGPMGVGRGQPYPQGTPGAGRGQQLTPQQMQALQAAVGRGQSSPGPVQPGQGPLQTMPMQAGRGQMPTGAAQTGRGQMPPQMVIGPGGIPRPVQAPPPHGNEPKYDQVPIPGGYQAVHGYGGGMMISPSPYNFAPMPMQYMQYPPQMMQQGMQQGVAMRQWDPRMMPPSQGGNSTNMVPQQHQQPQIGTPPQNPSPNNQIPEAQPMQIQQNAQQLAQQQQTNVNGQGHSQVAQQRIPDSQPQQSSAIHDSIQPNVGSVVQTQRNLHQRQSPSLSQSSPTTSTKSPKNQPVWVPALAPGQRSDSGSLQSSGPESMRQQSPQVERLNHAPIQPPVISQRQHSVLDSQSPTLGVAAGGFVRSPDATRLTSRMSTQNNMLNNTSRSPDSREDRTMSVSPEPPGPRPVPLHQVSEQASAQNLQVNVERANTHTRVESEDIYDATPRLPSSEVYARTQSPQSRGEGLSQQNKGFEMQNGVAVTSGTAAGAGAGAVIADNMSFLAEPDSSDPEEDEPTPAEGTEPQYPPQVSPPQQASPPPAAMNMEPEEKILVDMPVELAAVNDDDDGLPEMSATSYPGQEWNPYGAGEFEDYL